jgi:hypothetical protein
MKREWSDQQEAGRDTAAWAGGSAAPLLEEDTGGEEGDALYRRLAAPFATTFRDQRGGIELEYITGEQCVSRLNQVLSPTGWSFVVREHGRDPEADEVWVLGELTVHLGGQTATRQQFGSQKIRRAPTTNSPVDLGFDLKAAATDALKKCASLIGVGLYLARKTEGPSVAERGVPSASYAVGAPAGESAGRAEAGARSETRGERLVCETCGQELSEIRFRDGTAWLPSQLASLGRRKHGRVLCMEHYRQANNARRGTS